MAAATQLLLAFFLLSHAQAGEIFVSNFRGGTIGEYDASTGATINPALVSGLRFPSGLALAGGNLFVAFPGHGTVGKYTTSGATVNASLISGVDGATDVVVSKGNLFVTSSLGDTIGKYTTTGATLDASFISVSFPLGIALSDGKIFVASGFGTIGVYDAVTGATINNALVTGLFVPRFIAISGGDLFVSDNNGTVGVYDAATGAPIDPTLISTPGPRGMVFVGGNLLVADVGENVIEKFSPSGIPIDLAFVSGTQGLNGPEDIVLSEVVPESGPGLVAFGAVVAAMHFVRRRIIARPLRDARHIAKTAIIPKPSGATTWSESFLKAQLLTASCGYTKHLTSRCSEPLAAPMLHPRV